MIAFLLSPPALDRCGDKYKHLMQCSFSFSFSCLTRTAPWSDVDFFRQDRACRIPTPRPSLRPKKSARVLTDTAIRRPPDCAIDRPGNILGPWLYLRRSTYLTRKNWKRCGSSTNSGLGILWMRNVTVWFAAKLSRGNRSRSPAAPEGTGRCGSTVPRSVAIQYQLIGSCQPTKSWQFSAARRPSAAMLPLWMLIAAHGKIPRTPQPWQRRQSDRDCGS